MKTIKLSLLSLLFVGFVQTNCVAGYQQPSLKTPATTVTAASKIKAVASTCGQWVLGLPSKAEQASFNTSWKVALGCGALAAVGPALLSLFASGSPATKAACIGYLCLLQTAYIYRLGHMLGWVSADAGKSVHQCQEQGDEAYDNRLFLEWVSVDYPDTLARLKKEHHQHLVNKFGMHPDELIWVKPVTMPAAA